MTYLESITAAMIVALACPGTAQQAAATKPKRLDVVVLAVGGNSRIWMEEECVLCSKMTFEEEVIGADETLEQLWERHGGNRAAIPEVPADREVIGVFIGPGSGDRVDVVELLREPEPLLRVRASGTQTSLGRFAFLSLPQAISAVEYDEGTPGEARWRKLQLKGLHANWCRMGPASCWLHDHDFPAATPGQVFLDRMALLRFVRDQGAPALAGLDVDFTRDVVLLLPSSSFQHMMRASDRIVLRDEQPFRLERGQPWRAPGMPRLFRIERPASVIEIEGRTVERAEADVAAGAWSVQRRIVLPPPAPAALLPVLRVAEVLRPAGSDLCERIDTIEDWRALRHGWISAPSALCPTTGAGSGAPA